MAQEPHEQTHGQAAKRARFGASRTGDGRHEVRAQSLHNISGPPHADGRSPCVRLRPSPRAAKIPALSSEIAVPSAAPLLDTRLNGTRPNRHGKVRDLFDLGDRLLLVATDRISAFDYVLGSGIPDKGKVLTQLSAFWFEHTAGIVAQPPAQHRHGGSARRPAAASRDAPGPIDAGEEDHAARHRVRGARLSLGIGLEGIPGDRRGVRRGAARPACANPTASRRRSSRRPPRPAPATTSTSPRRRPARSSARRSSPRCAT